MPKIVIIYNPVSGRADERSRDAARSTLRSAGWSVDLLATQHGAHATDLAREAVRGGVDVVAVNGGDGTVAAAVEGLLGSGVPLGILPGGTGNQLARNLRIPTGSVPAARIIAGGRTRRIDVGEWERAGSTACFTVACGAGFDADVMAATTPEKKRRGRMTAYVTQALSLARELRPSAFEITVDGETRSVEASTVLVANCPRVLPPYRPIRPGVALDDGRLDVVWMRAAGLVQSLGVWSSLVTGRIGSSRIGHRAGLEIHVESEAGVRAERDGDVDGTTPFSARVRPSALEVLVPDRGRTTPIYM